MKRLSKKKIETVLPKCLSHLSSINFIIDNFLDDCCILTSDDIRMLLWREMDRECACMA